MIGPTHGVSISIHRMDENGWKALKRETSDDGSAKWTVQSTTRTFPHDSIETIYLVRGYDPTFEGKGSAFLHVLAAICTFSITYWCDEHWSERVENLWNGLSEKTIIVKRKKEKPLKRVQEIFNDHGLSNLNVGCDLHLKIQNKYLFTQFFGKECHVFINKLNENFNIKLKDPESYANLMSHLLTFSQDDKILEFIKKLTMFVDLQLKGPQNNEQFVRFLLTFFNNLPFSDACYMQALKFQKLNELEKSIGFLETCLNLFQGDKPVEKLPFAQQKTLQLLRAAQDFVEIKEKAISKFGLLLFTRHEYDIVSFFENLPKEQRMAILESYISSYMQLNENTFFSLSIDSLSFLIDVDKEDHRFILDSMMLIFNKTSAIGPTIGWNIDLPEDLKGKELVDTLKKMEPYAVFVRRGLIDYEMIQDSSLPNIIDNFSNFLKKGSEILYDSKKIFKFIKEIHTRCLSLLDIEKQKEQKILDRISTLWMEDFIRSTDLYKVYSFFKRIDEALFDQGIKVLKYSPEFNKFSEKNALILNSKTIPFFHQLIEKDGVTHQILEVILRLYSKFPLYGKLLEALVSILPKDLYFERHLTELCDSLNLRLYTHGGHDGYLDKYIEAAKAGVKFLGNSAIMIFRILCKSTINELELFSLICPYLHSKNSVHFVNDIKSFRGVGSNSNAEKKETYVKFISDYLGIDEVESKEKETKSDENDNSFKSGWKWALHFKDQVKDPQWLVTIAQFGAKLAPQVREKIVNMLLLEIQPETIDSLQKWKSLLENSVNLLFLLSEEANSTSIISTIPQDIMGIISSYKPTALELLKDKSFSYKIKFLEMSKVCVNYSGFFKLILEKTHTVEELDLISFILPYKLNCDSFDVPEFISKVASFKKLYSTSSQEDKTAYIKFISSSLENETKDDLSTEKSNAFRSGWEFALRFVYRETKQLIEVGVQDPHWLIKIAEFGAKLDGDMRIKLPELVLADKMNLMKNPQWLTEVKKIDNKDAVGLFLKKVVKKSENLKTIESVEKWISVLNSWVTFLFLLREKANSSSLISTIPQVVMGVISTYKPNVFQLEANLKEQNLPKSRES